MHRTVVDLPEPEGPMMTNFSPSFTSRLMSFKRITKNVYARTREACEKKLMVLIAQMDQEIIAQKARMAKDIQ